MKKSLAVLSVGALAALVVPSSAGAQSSLNDVPTIGPEFCTQWQAQLDAFKGQAEGAGTPFAEIHGGVQTLHDNACAEGGSEPPESGGEPPAPPEGGGEQENPLCAQFEDFATQAEAQPSPGPEFAAGLRDLAGAMECPADHTGNEDEDENNNEEDGGETTDSTTTTTAAVAGVTANNTGNSGAALPATGGGILAGGAGMGLLGLAAFARRFFGSA